MVEAWEIKENLCRLQDNSADGDNTELAEIYSEMGRVYMKLDDESDPEYATREVISPCERPCEIVNRGSESV